MRLILLLSALAASATGYALESPMAKTIYTSLHTNAAPVNKGSMYVGLSAGESAYVHGFPGCTVGYRKALDNAAIDVSATYSQQNSSHDQLSYFITAPKVTYLYYLQDNDQSPYAGVGLAGGALNKDGKDKFVGIMPHITLGYELGRSQTWCSFLAFTAYQPLLPVNPVHSIKHLPGPFGDMMVGIGF